jgi:peptidyl-prolyl cis-trans isomerase SurA
MFNEKMGEEFDRNEVPEMMKEFNVDNIAALKKYLETKLGSSLERERRLWIKEQIVRQWISMSVQRATAECTHDEMREFYEKNMELFTTPAKARWQEMVVFFSSHSTEQEALHKIRWMGNQVAGGAPFEEIAKANSDGFTASKGGLWDWTSKGSLSSTELEQAVFSQPIKQLSPAILRSDTGFHIVRVLERQEVTVVSLPEAQGTIREKIRNQRAQRYQAEYFADLRRRFPMIIVKERIDFSVNSPRTAAAVR